MRSEKREARGEIRKLYTRAVKFPKTRFSRLSLLVSLFLLAACGFHPLYGTQNNTAVPPKLAQIKVAFIKNSDGQILRNAILDRMPRPGPSQPYLLRVSLEETKVGIAISRDATVTRQQMRNTLHAELSDARTQQLLWKQDLFATSGYNILASQYSNLVGEEDARTRNLNDLADRLVGLLAMYFDLPEGAKRERQINDNTIPKPKDPFSPPAVALPGESQRNETNRGSLFGQ